MEEDTWNKITDLRANGSLSHFLSYFSVMEPSSPFSKTYPSFLTLKKGSTFLTKPLFLQEREDVTALQCYICPTCPSPAGGSLTHSQALALSKRARDVTAPSRCSEPLRSMDGGPSKVFAMLCGMGPPGDMVDGTVIPEVNKIFL